MPTFIDFDGGAIVWTTLDIADATKIDPFGLEDSAPSTDGAGVTSVPVAENLPRDQLNTCLVYEWDIGLTDPTIDGPTEILLIRFTSIAVAPQWALCGGLNANTAGAGAAAGIRRRTALSMFSNGYAMNHSGNADAPAQVLLTQEGMLVMTQHVGVPGANDAAWTASATSWDNASNGSAMAITESDPSGATAGDTMLCIAIADPFTDGTSPTTITFKAEFALVTMVQP